MLLGIVSAILMVGGGYLGLRVLGVGRGPSAGGLAPAVGIALLAVLSTWALRLGVPELLAGVVILATCLAGLAAGVRESVRRIVPLRFCPRLTPLILLAALLIPMVVLGFAIPIQAGVPDYPHDGAHHVETIEALRHGSFVPGFGWYPTGFHAPAAALLSLAPFVDSASGVVDWAVGVTLLAPLAMFGLGTALWRDVRVGAVSALLLALSSSYPYDPHLYSVWPMAAGVMLVLGLWTTAIEYLEHPRAQLAVLGGVLVGGIVLTHGTEIYTAALGIAAIAISRWKRVTRWSTIGHVGLAMLLALICVAPYLPVLTGWAGSGGAVAVGTEYFDVRRAALPHDAVEEALFWASSISSGVLVDLPLRLAFLGIGAWVAFRQCTARLLVPLVILFAALVATFRYVDAAPVRTVFALTLPWGVDDRLIMTVSVLAAPLGAAGLVWIGRALVRRSRVPDAAGGVVHEKWRRVARQALVLGLASGFASLSMIAWKFNLQTSSLVTYSRDDAAALTWLGQHTQPGEVVLNDGAADAGIWAPYKANVSIVLPRTRAVSPSGPEVLLRANLGTLDTNADVRAAACALHVHYVYRGEAPSPEARRFPGLDVLRASSALEEIFSSGEAALFRTRLDCPG